LKRNDGALADLAASVADGTPVDWRAAEVQADAPDRRLISHLRLVESIAALHRSVPLDDTEPTVDAPSHPAGPRWGRLVLLERIGQGTSCEVHRAWDSDLHRDVALKLLHDEGGGHRDAHARILSEARRLARVRHAHVVQVFGAEEHDNRVGLWMELVRGESLEHIVKTRGPFGAREAALIGLELCAALAAVHAAGLLHRDVKAQNVMREQGGRLVLMDFGTGEELAGTNRIVGTPLYLAPEIFRGQAASIQSDLYSLGVLLFYLVSGRFPVSAGSMEELASAHNDRRSQRLRDLRPDVPESFVGVVERALDGDPARRYRTVGELEAALRESLAAQSSEASRAIALPPPARRSRYSFAYLAAAAVLTLIVAGLLWRTGGRGSAPAALSSLTQTIAVLPLVEEAGSSAPSPFALGFTDELIATLGQVNSLRVISPAAVMPFRDRRTPLPAIAQKLNADALLETTLIPAGRGASGQPDPVRVRAQLFTAGFDTPIWQKTFDRPRGDTSALQNDIARAVADAMRVPVTETENARLRRAQQTTPAAEEAYLQGRIHLADYGVGAARRALEAFQRATRLDPKHAAARAGAARALVRLGTSGAMSQAEARASALSEARHALELDSALADAHAAQADIKFLYD
jgi:TolB-like protein